MPHLTSTVPGSLCHLEWLESPLVDGRKMEAYSRLYRQNIISLLLFQSRDATRRQQSSGLFRRFRLISSRADTNSLSRPPVRMVLGNGILVWKLRTPTSLIWAGVPTQTIRSLSLSKTRGQ